MVRTGFPQGLPELLKLVRLNQTSVRLGHRGTRGLGTQDSAP